MFYILGLYKGVSIGSFLIGSDTLPIQKQKNRYYLLLGWKMSVSDYVTETDVIMSKRAKYTKSIAISILRAEAQFAASAGQQGRSDMLKTYANGIEKYIFYYNKSAKDKHLIFHPSNDGSGEWNTQKGYGVAEVHVNGFLEGIMLSRAAFDAEIEEGINDTPFRVGQIREEMKAELDEVTDDTPLLYLFLQAQAALLERAKA